MNRSGQERPSTKQATGCLTHLLEHDAWPVLWNIKKVSSSMCALQSFLRSSVVVLVNYVLVIDRITGKAQGV